jgi:hypothetical protein
MSIPKPPGGKMRASLRIVAPLALAVTGAIAATGYANLQDASPAPQAAMPSPYVAPAPMSEAAIPPSDQPQVPVAADVATEPPIAQSAITVTSPRPSDDELLRNAVMDRLSSDPRLAGRIGVETYRHNVSLTGRVTTTSQIERAGTLAHSVDGVWRVDNYVLARVGQS